MIRVDLVTKNFAASQILKDISFEVARGETLALLGPSGIGKSTLLRLIVGADAEFEGSITRPDSMAMVFQEPTLLPWRSVFENIRLVHPHLNETQVNSALTRVGIGDKAGLFPNQLSLGQQRRLALARAFARQPELLIMDEPFASLDHDIAQDMLALTEDLIAESSPATIFVTHNPEEAARLADRTLLLGGSPATLVPRRIE